MTNVDNTESIRRTAYRARMLIARVPLLAEDPNAALDLARQPIPDYQLLSAANGMQVARTTAASALALRGMDASEQRVTWDQLPQAQRQMLVQQGYSPPEIHQGGFVGKPGGGLIGGALRAVGNVGEIIPDALNPVFEQTFGALNTVANVPTWAYRTIRSQPEWVQALALAGAVAATGGLAAAGAGAFGAGTAALAATSGAIGTGAAYGGAALVGGVGTTALAQVLSGNGGEWFDITQDAWNGERLFSRDAQRQAREVLQGDDAGLSALARKLAHTDAYDLAESFVGRRDATHDSVQRATMERLVKEAGYDVSVDPTGRQLFADLEKLRDDPKMQEAIRILQESKISIGRDVVETLGIDEGEWGYGTISGLLDASAAVVLDPTMILGKAIALRKLKQFSMGVDEAGKVIGNAEDMRLAMTRAGAAEVPTWRPRARQIYNSEQSVRDGFAVIAKAVEADEVEILSRNLPHLRASWETFRTWRSPTQVATEVGHKMDTPERVLEFFENTEGMEAILHGRAGSWERGYAALPRLTASGAAWARAKGALRVNLDFAGDLEKQGAVVGRWAGDIMGPEGQTLKREAGEALWHQPAPDEIVEGAREHLMRIAPVLEDEARNPVPTTLAQAFWRSPAVGRIARDAASLFDGMGTQVPEAGALPLTGPKFVAEVQKFVHMTGKLGVPSAARYDLIRLITTQDNEAFKLRALQHVYATVFKTAGLEELPEGRAFMEKWGYRLQQQYSLADDTANSALDLSQRVASLPEADAADFLAIPNYKEMSRAVHQGTLLNQFLRVTNIDWLDAKMTSIWKPAVLLRLGFIPRAAGEELLAFVAQHGLQAYVRQLRNVTAVNANTEIIWPLKPFDVGGRTLERLAEHVVRPLGKDLSPLGKTQQWWHGMLVHGTEDWRKFALDGLGQRLPGWDRLPEALRTHLTRPGTWRGLVFDEVDDVTIAKLRRFWEARATGDLKDITARTHGPIDVVPLEGDTRHRKLVYQRTARGDYEVAPMVAIPGVSEKYANGHSMYLAQVYDRLARFLEDDQTARQALLGLTNYLDPRVASQLAGQVAAPGPGLGSVGLEEDLVGAAGQALGAPMATATLSPQDVAQTRLALLDTMPTEYAAAVGEVLAETGTAKAIWPMRKLGDSDAKAAVEAFLDDNPEAAIPELLRVIAGTAPSGGEWKTEILKLADEAPGWDPATRSWLGGYLHDPSVRVGDTFTDAAEARTRIQTRMVELLSTPEGQAIFSRMMHSTRGALTGRKVFNPVADGYARLYVPRISPQALDKVKEALMAGQGWDTIVAYAQATGTTDLLPLIQRLGQDQHLVVDELDELADLAAHTVAAQQYLVPLTYFAVDSPATAERLSTLFEAMRQPLDTLAGGPPRGSTGYLDVAQAAGLRPNAGVAFVGDRRDVVTGVGKTVSTWDLDPALTPRILHFPRDGQAITLEEARAEYAEFFANTFAEVGRAKDDPSRYLWDMVSPMMMDTKDSLALGQRVSRRVDAGRVTRSGADLPDVVLGPRYRKPPDEEGWWARTVRYGFDGVIAPAIDAIVRTPLAMHNYMVAQADIAPHLAQFRDVALFGDERTAPVLPRTQRTTVMGDVTVVERPGGEPVPAWPGGPTMFHGTATRIPDDQLGGLEVGATYENLYGPGFYSTDTEGVAGEYAGHRTIGGVPYVPEGNAETGARLYNVVWQGHTPPRFLDLDTPLTEMPADVRATMQRWLDSHRPPEVDLTGMTPDELEYHYMLEAETRAYGDDTDAATLNVLDNILNRGVTPKMNLEEGTTTWEAGTIGDFMELANSSIENLYSHGEAIEQSLKLTHGLRDLGYDGMEHVGGQRIPGAVPHNVKAWWRTDMLQLHATGFPREVTRQFPTGVTREQVEVQQLGTFTQLARKHGFTPDGLLARWNNLPPDLQAPSVPLETVRTYLKVPISGDDMGTLRAAAANAKHTEDLAHTMAMERAINDSVPFIDDHGIRSQFQDGMRTLMPFWFAEEAFMKRWARTLRIRPEAIRAGQLTMHGLKSIGAIQTDANGEDWFVYPGSTALIDTISRIPFFGQYASVPVAQAMGAPVMNVLPGFGDRFGTPSLSPIAAFPLQQLTNLFPELQPVEEAFIGEAGASRSGLNTLWPSSLRRVWDVYTSFRPDPEETNRAYGAAMMSAIQMLAAKGEAPDASSSPQEIEDFLAKVRNHTRVVLLVQAVVGFVGPASPQVQTLAGGAFDLTNLTGLDPQRSPLREEFLQLVRQLGVEEGTRRYLEHHEEATPFDIVDPLAFGTGLSESVSGAVLPATTAAMSFYEANHAWMKDYPDAGPWFLPPGRNAEEAATFDRASYSEQEAWGLRVRRSPEELLTAMQFKRAAPDYFQTQDQIKLALKQTTSPAQRAAVDSVWTTWQAGYLARNPVFAQELRSGEGRARRMRVIEQLTQAFADPNTPRPWHVTHLEELFKAFDAHRLAKGSLSTDRSAAATKKKDTLDALIDDWATQFVTQHPEVAPLWYGILRPEANLE